MSEIREVKPDYNGRDEAASYYFYSEYDPATHFEYMIPFLKDGKTIDVEALNNPDTGTKIQAFRKAIKHHFDFEQVLPKEETDFVKFYRPFFENNRPQDYNYNFELKTQSEFEQDAENILREIPIKSEYIYKVAQSGFLEKEYSKMTYEELIKVYNDWNTYLITNPQFIDATNWNKHCYECALYCKVYRPRKLDSQGQLIPAKDSEGHIIPEKYEFVSPYEFRKILKLVNSIFNFKIPIEEGWYRFNKPEKKWEYITFLKEGE